jgi:hypothetical protein
MTTGSAPACRRQGKVDIKALITDEVKPGILSSTPASRDFAFGSASTSRK